MVKIGTKFTPIELAWSCHRRVHPWALLHLAKGTKHHVMYPCFYLIMYDYYIMIIYELQNEKTREWEKNTLLLRGGPRQIFLEDQIWALGTTGAPSRRGNFWWSSGTSAPNCLRATPPAPPKNWAQNSHFPQMVLEGEVGHQTVPLITLIHPI